MAGRKQRRHWDSEKDCQLRKMWDEWREIYVSEGQKEAAQFFKKNRER